MINDQKKIREAMTLAVNVMKQSSCEKRKDGKVPPKVGAVILFDDGTMESAYRGEFRSGDHAEYTLIDKKLRTRKLEEAILFATLEPCAPNSRGEGKLPCAERIVNARIKKVYMGIQDPHPSVSGKGHEYLLDNGIAVEMFDKDLQEEIINENRAFLDDASLRAYFEDTKQKENGKVHYLDVIVPKMDFYSDFSKDAFQKYFELSGSKTEYDSPDFWHFLEISGITNNESKNGKAIHTFSRTAVLLFGKFPSQTCPQFEIKASAFGSNKSFSGPLILEIQAVFQWLSTVVNSQFVVSGLTGSEPLLRALREAVLNAVIHRDYSREDAQIRISIDNDKIEVLSPGSPTPPISIDQLRDFSAPTLQRNPKLSFLFSKIHFYEGNRKGMECFKNLLFDSKKALYNPNIEFNNPNLIVTFYRSFKSYQKSLNGVFSSLNENEFFAYQYLKLRKITTKTEYAKESGRDLKSAYRDLNRLVELRLIGAEGDNRGRRYKLLK